jgi:hypothetical protein
LLVERGLGADAGKTWIQNALSKFPVCLAQEAVAGWIGPDQLTVRGQAQLTFCPHCHPASVSREKLVAVAIINTRRRLRMVGVKIE